MKKYSLILLTFLGFISQAQNQKTFSVSDFSAIEVHNSLSVNIKKGAYSVSAEGRTEDLSYLVAEVKNGKLAIFTNKKGNYFSSKKISVHISLPTLQELDVSGASQVQTESGLLVNTTKIKASGGSKINVLAVESLLLKIDISGASEVHLSGSTKSLELKSSGASELNAFDLDIKKATVNASGASSLKLTVSDDITIKLSGASEAKIKGNPQTHSELTGASTLKNIK